MNTEYSRTNTFKAIEGISTKEELEKRKRKILIGIDYHTNNNNQIQVATFKSQLEHVNKRLSNF
jgi:hypothetical protein